MEPHLRTISYRRSHRSPPGDTVKLCSYCGVAYYRSQLRCDASGNLACPEDQRGRDSVTLNEGNAAALANRRLPGQTGMPTDGTADSPSTDVAPAVSWNQPAASTPNGGPTGQLSVNVVMWLRGDGFTKSNPDLAGIQGFIDQSNSGNSPQSVGTTLPVAGVVNLPGSNPGTIPIVSFAGTPMRMAMPLRTAGTMWLWFIFVQTGFGAGAAMFNNGCAITQQVSSPILRMQTAGANNSGATAGVWTRGIASFTTAGTDDLQLGSTLTSNASPGTRIGTTFVLGANNVNGTGGMIYSLAEFLMTLSPPTAAEIAALDVYGKARYGTTVQF